MWCDAPPQKKRHRESSVKIAYCSFKHPASISAWLKNDQLPDLFPDSRRGARPCQTSVCTSTKPVSFPLSRLFSARRFSNAGAIILCVLRQRFPSRRTNEARSWSPPRLSLISSPLSLQIEERAIQELLLHYRAHDNPDELIVVERASKGPIAAPTWNKH